MRGSLGASDDTHWRAGTQARHCGGCSMNNIIYIIGLIVVVLAILSFLGLR